MKKNIKNLRRMDKLLFLVMLLLVVIGVVMIFSASNVTSVLRYGKSPWNYFAKQLIWLFISIIFFLVILFIDEKYHYPLTVVGLGIIFLLLLIVIFKGTYVNQTRGWLLLFNNKIGVQPSEMFKVAYILFASMYYDKYKLKLTNPKYAFTPLIVGIIGTLLIAIQPDFGTAMVTGLIVLFIYYITPLPKRYKRNMTYLIAISVVMGVLMYFSNTKVHNYFTKEQKKRFNLRGVCTEERFYTDGNQLCNSLIAFNNGGLFGKGLSNSSQKYLYLPESHTDFIFAIITEELGFIGAFLIILLYMVLLARMVMIGRKATKNSDASLSYAVAFMLFLHIFLNIGGISLLVPLTGIPLPFLSYGGTNLIVNISAIAFIEKASVNSYKVKKRTT